MTATALESPPRATFDDLMGVEGKAELIGGKVVTFMPAGRHHGDISGNIYTHLRPYARLHGGAPYGDSIGFVVPEMPGGRESFSPDAAYFAGPHLGRKRDFVVGPPTFAVEIRSKGDYGPAPEDQMERKREDYFEAGTLAVWDVDLEAQTIKLYVRANPSAPILFCPGEMAHAEPALPGWTMPVDDVFEEWG